MKKTEIKRTAALILAAGSGSRMQSDKTKQNIEILGESLLERSIRAFEECEAVNYIIVVAKEDELKQIEKKAYRFKKVTKVVKGGSSRCESARNGFYALEENTDLIAVHDAARCLITPDMIEKVISSASLYGAATAVSRIVDTLKLSENGFIKETLPREKIFAASTPQVFLVDLYKKALDNSANNSDVTDDNMLIERLGEPIFCVDVGRENLKITTKEDLDLAKYIIEKRMKNE